MRVATWNVNSIRARTGRVIDWLLRENVDVLAMQETKCSVAQFPVQAFEEAGYRIEVMGVNQWNGVAFASTLPIDAVTQGFPEAPGFGPEGAVEARALGVEIAGLALWSLYVPNGRELADPHYRYKLEWLQRLREHSVAWMRDNPGRPLALMGDWNIAPLDSDVWDMRVFAGATHVSQPERDEFFAFEEAGLHDVVRPLVPDGFTYWDYKQLRFPRNEGMRIDFILGNDAFADRVEAAAIFRDERKGEAPSDHVPVAVDLTDTDAFDDDRPMVF